MDAEEPGSLAEAVDLTIGECVVALGAEVPVGFGVTEGSVGGERVALGPDRGQREIPDVVKLGQEPAVEGTAPGGGGEERMSQDAVLAEQDERGRVEPCRGEGDKLDVEAIDANLNVAGDQDFTFKGSAAFTGIGQLRFVTSGQDRIIQGNNDSDLSADFEIFLRLFNSPSPGSAVLASDFSDL